MSRIFQIIVNSFCSIFAVTSVIFSLGVSYLSSIDEGEYRRVGMFNIGASLHRGFLVRLSVHFRYFCRDSVTR